MSMQTVLVNLKNAIENKCNSLISSHNADNNAHNNILSNVAKTGNYNDLSNKPTIPTAVTVDSVLSDSSTNPVENNIITNALNDKSNTNHTHSNWQEVYNNKNLVIQYNSVIGLCHAVFALQYNFKNNDSINYITNIPSPYRPPASMVCFGHPAGTVHISLNSTGVLQFKRLTGTGLTYVSGVWVYIGQ